MHRIPSLEEFIGQDLEMRDLHINQMFALEVHLSIDAMKEMRIQ